MKKSICLNESCPLGRSGNSCFRIGIFLFMLFIGLPRLDASSPIGQNNTVSLKNSEMTIRELFATITEQLKYDIFFSDDEFNVNRMVRLSSNEMRIDQLLREILEGKYSYELINRTIVISPAKQKDVQKVLIKGKVMDEKAQPLPGVTVLLKGTALGIATDNEGKFALTLPKSDDMVLVFSFVGMTTAEVKYTGQKEIIIALRPSSSRMDEAIAVGYGTTRRKDLTGSVTRLGQEEIKNAPMGATVQSMLQGKAAGVNVMIGSASPTAGVSVVIRGASSLSGDSQPLWVIDGVPEYNAGTSGDITNTLYNLNLTDVESIDILKDASATAIYGSRAANGVIIVTTKRGQERMKPQLEFSANYGVQVMDANGFDVMNADEYKAFSKKALAESLMSNGRFDYWLEKYYDREKFNKINHSQFDLESLTDDMLRENAFGDGDTDWWKLMTHNATTEEYNLSLRGGSIGSSYSASVFYNRQNGIVKGGSSSMLGANFNFDATIRDIIRFRMGLRASSRKTEDKDQMLSTILQMRPDVRPYNEDGSINRIDYYVKNPLLELDDINDGKGRNFTGNMGLEWDIIDGLTLRTNASINYSISSSNYFRVAQYEDDENQGNMGKYESSTYVIDNTLTYMKFWKKHKFTGLLGFSAEKYESESLSASAAGYPDNKVLINLGSAAKIDDVDNSYDANTLVSCFSRLEYKYNDRYLITLNFRGDGSSKFGPDKRWGFFPSGAVAWIISEEEFLKDYSYIFSYLKLRASYGKTGSQNLGNYDWRNLMDAEKYNGKPGIVPSTLGNDILQWEEQTQKEIGLDYGLWNDRIRGTLGFYEKKVDNLLYYDPVAISSSFNNVVQNIGALKNSGVEFDIQFDVIQNREKDLTWNVDFNIYRNRTKLLKLDSQAEYFGSDYDWNRVKVGDETGFFYGYRDAGRLLMYEEEVIAMKHINETGGYLEEYRNWSEHEGDLYLMDLNGDGKVGWGAEDKEIIANCNPDFAGGFGSTLYWKGLMVNATFSYAVGADRLDHKEYSAFDNINVYNSTTKVLQSWTMAPGVNTYHPRAGFSYGNMQMTRRYIHDASYLRLTALNLSYRFPESMFKNSILENLEFSFQASNLFTWTKYTGMDPQGNFSMYESSLRGMGVDYSEYPAARTFSFGLRVTLK